MRKHHYSKVEEAVQVQVDFSDLNEFLNLNGFDASNAGEPDAIW
jgi:hypothetical protein